MYSTEPMTKKNFSLKDQLFNKDKVHKISLELKAAYSDFNPSSFTENVMSKFPELELKERIYWISDCLKTHLPPDYPAALTILLNALPKPCDPTLSDDDFGDFIYATYAQFVVDNGCKPEFVDTSLNALEQMTQRFSAEDAIRYFINKFPEDTFSKLKKWASHTHYHVRRLVTEGTRPSLPWAQKINYDPKLYLPLLDQLHKDPTRFVTRSIANHLNDVSKFSPELVLTCLNTWQKDKKQNEKELCFMARHSLRTLVKKGHPGTLSFLGFNPTIKAKVGISLDQDTLKIGESLFFKISLQGTVDEPLIVDFVMYFQGKGGKLREKVFKLKTMSIKAHEQIEIEKKYTFTANMSTRAFYPGAHYIQAQVNGKRLDKVPFELLA